MTDEIFDLHIKLDEIPANGTTRRFEADGAQRAALAGWLTLEAVERFIGTLKASWTENSRGVVVEGDLAADVVQACVVTGEPVPAAVARRFKVTLLPPEDLPDLDQDGDDFVIDLDGDDPPEPLVGRSIDLGALAIEQLGLGLEPYPRVDGAEFDADLFQSEAPVSPFAVLAELQTKKSKD
jgi:uncharacterized metal-binding protein YceD (DUF177 family)